MIQILYLKRFQANTLLFKVPRIISNNPKNLHTKCMSEVHNANFFSNIYQSLIKNYSLSQFFLVTCAIFFCILKIYAIKFLPRMINLLYVWVTLRAEFQVGTDEIDYNWSEFLFKGFLCCCYILLLEWRSKLLFSFLHLVRVLWYCFQRNWQETIDSLSNDYWLRLISRN